MTEDDLKAIEATLDRDDARGRASDPAIARDLLAVLTMALVTSVYAQSLKMSSALARSTSQQLSTTGNARCIPTVAAVTRLSHDSTDSREPVLERVE